MPGCVIGKDMPLKMMKSNFNSNIHIRIKNVILSSVSHRWNAPQRRDPSVTHTYQNMFECIFPDWDGPGTGIRG